MCTQTRTRAERQKETARWRRKE